MVQDLTIYDLEELVELSEITYKKVYGSEDAFSNIIEKTIIEYENEVYFLTNAFKLAKYTKLESNYELIIYSHTFEKDKFNLEIKFNASDVFGRTPISSGLETLGIIFFCIYLKTKLFCFRITSFHNHFYNIL